MTYRKAKDENYSRAQRLKARQKEAKPILAEIKAVLDAITQVTLSEKILEKTYGEDFILSGAGKKITIEYAF